MVMLAVQACSWLFCDGEPHCLRACPGCLIWPTLVRTDRYRQSCYCHRCCSTPFSQSLPT
ncbi:hypothetical protein NEUTE1DRAFT_121317, partial [Neurospora tetrasperma FGSC 2508]